MKRCHEFLMPDYYPAFSCKMGACRSACCVGWPISFTMSDYFKLLGIECSPELRRKLDCAMHLSEHPSPESYAQISPRYDGQCPMRLEDGRCGIHAELGEDALAAVCRLYPRAVHADESYECSCANSCEAVLEMFLKRQESMAFVSRTLTIDIPDGADELHHFQTIGREQEIGLQLIALIQDRTKPLPQRIVVLGQALADLEDELKARNKERVDALLSGREHSPIPETPDAGQKQLICGLKTMEAVLEIVDKGNNSVRTYGEAVLAYFADHDLQKYLQAKERFQEMLPQWEIWFEHMLVNHMFFTRFPFQDPSISLHDKFLGLCAVYVLVRFLCIGWAAQYSSIDAVVDAAAAAFRLIDHSDFDRYAAHILKKLGCSDYRHLGQILCI